MAIAVVTDTCAYLTPEAVAEHGINLVSLYVNQDGVATRESDIRDLGAYFGALAGAERLPTTSQPSVGDFLEVYEPLVTAGLEVVSFHLSGAMSGTVNAAGQARAALGDHAERVTVVDTHVACGAQGLMAQTAARAAARGADVATVVARAQEVHDALRFWFTMESLEYLRRGGRIGGAAAWMGTALQIKPILSLSEQITPVERVRTTRRAFERIVTLLGEAHDAGNDAWAVQHIQAFDYADALVERGREIFGCEPEFSSEIGPVIGTHVGPGFFGAGAFPASVIA